MLICQSEETLKVLRYYNFTNNLTRTATWMGTPIIFSSNLTEHTLANLFHTDDINILIHHHDLLRKLRLCCIQYVTMTHYHRLPSPSQMQPHGPTLMSPIFLACCKTPAIFSFRLAPYYVTTQPITKLTTSTEADLRNAVACDEYFLQLCFGDDLCALGPSFTPLAPNDADATALGEVILNDLWGGISK
jgi:hypothetical protein